MKNLKNLVILLGVVVVLFFFGLYVGNVLSIGRCIGGDSILVKTVVDGQEFYQNVGASTLRQILEFVFDAVLILLPIVLVPILYARSCATYRQLNIGEIAECEDMTRLDNCLQTLMEIGKAENSMLSQTGLDTDFHYALHNAISFKQECLRKYMKECQEASNKAGINLACCAALSVIVSPSSVGDTLFLLFWNIRAINTVLKIYDLRPGALALLRIYGEVLLASFTVGSIDDVLDSANILGMGKGIPFFSQLTQGAGTLFAIFRTISLTQYFICHGVTAENRILAKREARAYAANTLMRLPADKQFRETMMKATTKGWDFLSNSVQNLFSDEQPPQETNATDEIPQDA